MRDARGVLRYAKGGGWVHSDSFGYEPFEERSLSDHFAKRAVWWEVVDSVGEFGLTGWVGDQFVESPREGLSRGIST